MNLKKQLATKNECYIRGDKMKPIGIVVHSTGANNPALKRYVQPDDGLLGKNIYNNSWNNFRPGGRQICCHAFIGKLENGAIATYQILPWETRGWHAGSGKNGSANGGYIGFEICEDNTQNADYAKQTYQEAVEFCAHLVKLYPAIKYENIIGHYEAAARGIASRHADPQHWWKKHKLSMAQFRKDVKSKVEAETKPKPTPGDTLYRVQVGAFRVRSNAENYAAQIKKAGFDAYVVTAQAKVPDKPKPVPAIKKGDRVTVRKGAKTYTGGILQGRIYTTTFDVLEVPRGNRIVIGLKGQVTAAMQEKDLAKV